MSSPSSLLLQLAYQQLIDESTSYSYRDQNRLDVKSLDDLRPSDVVKLLSLPKDYKRFLLATTLASEEALLEEYTQLGNKPGSFAEAMACLANAAWNQSHAEQAQTSKSASSRSPTASSVTTGSYTATSSALNFTQVEYDGLLVPLVPAHLLGLYSYLLAHSENTHRDNQVNLVVLEQLVRRSNLVKDTPQAVTSADALRSFSFEAFVDTDLVPVLACLVPPEYLVAYKQQLAFVWQERRCGLHFTDTNDYKLVTACLNNASKLVLLQSLGGTLADYYVSSLAPYQSGAPLAFVNLTNVSSDIATNDLTVRGYLTPALMRKLAPLYQELTPTNLEKLSQAYQQVTQDFFTTSNTKNPQALPKGYQPFVAAHLCDKQQLDQLQQQWEVGFSAGAAPTASPAEFFLGEAKSATKGAAQGATQTKADPALNQTQQTNHFADLKELAAQKDKFAWAYQRLVAKYKLEQNQPANSITLLANYWKDGFSQEFITYLDKVTRFNLDELKEGLEDNYKLIGYSSALTLQTLTNWDLTLLALASLEQATESQRVNFYRTFAWSSNHILPYVLAYIGLTNLTRFSSCETIFNLVLGLNSKEAYTTVVQTMLAYWEQAEQASNGFGVLKALQKLIAAELDIDPALLEPEAAEQLTPAQQAKLVAPAWVAQATNAEGTSAGTLPVQDHPAKLTLAIYLARWFNPNLLEALQTKFLEPALVDCQLNQASEQGTASERQSETKAESKAESKAEKQAYQARTSLALTYLQACYKFGNAQLLRLDYLVLLLSHPDALVKHLAHVLLGFDVNNWGFTAGTRLGYKSLRRVSYDFSDLLEPPVLDLKAKAPAPGTKLTKAQQTKLERQLQMQLKIVDLTKQALELAQATPVTSFSFPEASSAQEASATKIVSERGITPMPQAEFVQRNLKLVPSQSLFAPTTDYQTNKHAHKQAGTHATVQASASASSAGASALEASSLVTGPYMEEFEGLSAEEKLTQMWQLNLDIYLKPINALAAYQGKTDALNLFLSTKTSDNTTDKHATSKVPALEGGAAAYQARSFSFFTCEPQYRMVNQLAHPENLSPSLLAKLEQLGKVHYQDSTTSNPASSNPAKSNPSSSPNPKTPVLSGTLTAADLEQIDFSDLLACQAPFLSNFKLMPICGSLEYLIACQKVRPLLLKLFIQARDQAAATLAQNQDRTAVERAKADKKAKKATPTIFNLPDPSNSNISDLLRAWVQSPAEVVGDGVGLVSTLKQLSLLKTPTYGIDLSRALVGYQLDGEHYIGSFTQAPTLIPDYYRFLHINSAYRLATAFAIRRSDIVLTGQALPHLAEGLKARGYDRDHLLELVSKLPFPAQIKLIALLAQDSAAAKQQVGSELLLELLQKPQLEVASSFPSPEPYFCYAEAEALALAFARANLPHEVAYGSGYFVGDFITKANQAQAADFIQLVVQLRGLFETKDAKVLDHLSFIDAEIAKLAAQAGVDLQSITDTSVPEVTAATAKATTKVTAKATAKVTAKTTKTSVQAQDTDKTPDAANAKTPSLTPSQNPTQNPTSDFVKLNPLTYKRSEGFGLWEDYDWVHNPPALQALTGYGQPAFSTGVPFIPDYLEAKIESNPEVWLERQLGSDSLNLGLAVAPLKKLTTPASELIAGYEQEITKLMAQLEGNLELEEKASLHAKIGQLQARKLLTLQVGEQSYQSSLPAKMTTSQLEHLGLEWPTDKIGAYLEDQGIMSAQAYAEASDNPLWQHEPSLVKAYKHSDGKAVLASLKQLVAPTWLEEWSWARQYLNHQARLDVAALNTIIDCNRDYKVGVGDATVSNFYNRLNHLPDNASAWLLRKWFIEVLQGDFKKLTVLALAGRCECYHAYNSDLCEAYTGLFEGLFNPELVLAGLTPVIGKETTEATESKLKKLLNSLLTKKDTQQLEPQDLDFPYVYAGPDYATFTRAESFGINKTSTSTKPLVAGQAYAQELEDNALLAIGKYGFSTFAEHWGRFKAIDIDHDTELVAEYFEGALYYYYVTNLTATLAAQLETVKVEADVAAKVKATTLKPEQRFNLHQYAPLNWLNQATILSTPLFGSGLFDLPAPDWLLKHSLIQRWGITSGLIPAGQECAQILRAAELFYGYELGWVDKAMLGKVLTDTDDSSSEVARYANNLSAAGYPLLASVSTAQDPSLQNHSASATTNGSNTQVSAYRTIAQANAIRTAKFALASDNYAVTGFVYGKWDFKAPKTLALLQELDQLAINLTVSAGTLGHELLNYLNIRSYHWGADVLTRLLTQAKNLTAQGIALPKAAKATKISSTKASSTPAKPKPSKLPQNQFELARTKVYPDFHLELEAQATQLAQLVAQRQVEVGDLLAVGFVNPAWLPVVEKALDWPGLTMATHYFRAHTAVFSKEGQEQFLNHYTDIPAADFSDGSVDVTWFKKARLGLTQVSAKDLAGSTNPLETRLNLAEQRWEQLYNAAKYLEGGKSHTRARKFADAVEGKYDPRELEVELEAKRNQDLLLTYALVPLNGEGFNLTQELPKLIKLEQEFAQDKASQLSSEQNQLLLQQAVVQKVQLNDEEFAELTRRYLFIRKFASESKVFGAQRRASEMRSVNIALQNLAFTAGFSDPSRLTWEVEAKLEPEADVFEPYVAGDVTCQLIVGQVFKPSEAISRAAADSAVTAVDDALDAEKIKLIFTKQQTAKSGKTQTKLLKAVPAALKKDARYLELKELVDELAAQRLRTKALLQQSMQLQSSFSPSQIKACLQNSALAPLLSKLVWTCTLEPDSPGKTTANKTPTGKTTASETTSGKAAANNTAKKFFGLPELTAQGLVLVDAKGNQVVVPELAVLTVSHVFDLHTAGIWAQYQELLFKLQLVQPFKQVFRELYLKRDTELDGAETKRFAGHQLKPNVAFAVLKNVGWKTSNNTIERVFHQANLVVSLWGLAIWEGDYEPQVFEHAKFSNRLTGEPVAIKDVPDVIFSEVLRDLDLIVAIAHAGTYDPETSSSTLEMRAKVVDLSAKLLGFSNVSVPYLDKLAQAEAKGQAQAQAKTKVNRQRQHFVQVEGTFNTYQVHLASGIIHQEGGPQIAVAALQAQDRGRLFIPFVDEDPKTAEVLSKVLLLAADDKIKDPRIVGQIVKLKPQLEAKAKRTTKG